MIVAKAVSMAQMMDVPILGIVENMSYVKCPDCGKKIPVFGESHVEEVCARFGLPLLGRLPMDPALAKNCDAGLIELAETNELEAAVNVVEQAGKK